MQCILYKIYFWKGFSYVLQIDMHLICAPLLTKFYSCKKWVLHRLLILLHGNAMSAKAQANSLQILERIAND
jgi:hypothetical protein